MKIVDSFFVRIDALLKSYQAEEVFFESGSKGVLIDHLGRNIGLSYDIEPPESLDWLEFLFLLADVAKCRISDKNPTQGGIHSATNIRWHLVLAPLLSSSFLFVCRKHSFHSGTMNLPSNWDEYHSEVETRHRSCSAVVIYGPSGSGKTTFLHSMMSLWLANSRTVIVEMFEELPSMNPLWSKLKIIESRRADLGKSAYHALVGTVLRLRPQSIVIGETRLTEMELLGWLSNTGHGVVWTTMHARSLVEIAHTLAPYVKADFRKESIFGIGLSRQRDGRSLIAECGLIN